MFQATLLYFTQVQSSNQYRFFFSRWNVQFFMLKFDRVTRRLSRRKLRTDMRHLHQELIKVHKWTDFKDPLHMVH